MVIQSVLTINGRPGAQVPHCSSLPLHAKDCFSLFTTLNWGIEKAFHFQNECNKAQELLRMAGYLAGTFAGYPAGTFAVEDKVAVRFEDSRAVGNSWWHKMIVFAKDKHMLQVYKPTSQMHLVWVKASDSVPLP